MLRGTGFTQVGFPEGISFGEGWVEGIGRKIRVDEGFGAATVTGMDTDRFAKELEWLVRIRRGWDIGAYGGFEITSFTLGVKGCRAGSIKPVNVI